MSTADSPRLAYRIAEAGALLGLSKKAAQSAADRGHIPTVKIGGLRFVSAAALARLLGETGPQSDQEQASNE